MPHQDLGTLTYDVDGAVARIVLNDPGRANSQTSEMVHAFDDALTLADRDYAVKVVVIKANGKGFCAGHAAGGGYTYPEFAENMEHWDSVWKAQSDLFLWPTLRLWEFRKPTIAQVHGYALGGGTYWALLPDITVASDDAYFQMPLVQGLGFPGGETMIEPWVFMNWKRTYEYLYTAQTLTAVDALEMGLVNRVVARDDLDATVDELAANVARAPLSTLMATKQLVKRGGSSMGMRVHLQMSTDVMAVPPRRATRTSCAWRWPSVDSDPVSRRRATTPTTTAEPYGCRPSSSLRSMPGGSLGMRPLPMPFIICCTVLNCFSSALTSAGVTPLPSAMRTRREPLMTDGFPRSAGVIEQMIASMRLISRSSISAFLISLGTPGSMPSTFCSGPIFAPDASGRGSPAA